MDTKVCSRCGASNSPDRAVCISCQAPLDPQATDPRALGQAWEAAKLRKSLGGSGIWSILWGIMALVMGLAMLEESGANIVLVGIGAFLIVTGIAGWARPGPATLIMDACALLLVGLWNVFISLGNWDSSQMVWLAVGVVQIGWAIGRFRGYGRYKEVQHVPISLSKHAEGLVNGVQRANVRNDPGVVQFRAEGKAWKVRLLPDLVVAVAGNAQEVRFVTPDRFELTAPQTEKRWVQGTVRLGWDTWTGNVSQDSPPRYAAWRQALVGSTGQTAAAESAEAEAVPSVEAPISPAAVTEVVAAVPAAPADAPAEAVLPAASPPSRASSEVVAAIPAATTAEERAPAWRPVVGTAGFTAVGTAEPVSPPRSTWWPPAIALLNLTGLGLGYLAMGRWLRWLVHGVLTLIVVLAGRNLGPVGWPVLTAVWLLWMVLDGWRQARKAGGATAPARFSKSWAPAIVALLVVGLEAWGVLGYRAEGLRAYVRGRTAYELGDAALAREHFSRVVDRPLVSAAMSQLAERRLRELDMLDQADKTLASGRHESAIERYQAFVDTYPQSAFAARAQESIYETYAAWSEALCAEAKYLEAIKTLTQAYPTEEGAAVPATLSTAYEAALRALAGDTGKDGASVQQATWRAICEQAELAPSPAVGLFSDQAALAWYGGNDLKLSDVEWMAGIPGHFRYALCLKEEFDVVQSCGYFPVGTVRRQRVNWRVYLQDVLTGELVTGKTFTGGEPSACPKSQTFYGNSYVVSRNGEDPDQTEILEWIDATMAGISPASVAVEIKPPAPVAKATPGATPVQPGATRVVPDKPAPTPFKGPVQLTVAHPWQTDRAAALQDLIYTYEDSHPEVRVEVVTAEDRAQLDAIMAAGEADVVMYTGPVLRDWAADGLLAPLTPYADEAWMRERYLDKAVDAVTVDGTIYGLPLDADVLAMVYNRALVSEEDLPKTTDDLLRNAQEWGSQGSYFMYDPTMTYWSAGWFHGGEAWFTNEACAPNLNVPDGIAAAEWIAALRDIMPEDVGLTTAWDLFDAGELAITIDGLWRLSAAEKAGIDCGVAPFPVLSATGVQPAPYVDVDAWMITTRAADQEKADAAWGLIRALASLESQQILADKLDLVPSARPEGGELDPFQALAEQGTLMPPDKCMSAVWVPVGSMLKAIWEGEDPAKAVADTQTTIEAAASKR